MWRINCNPSRSLIRKFLKWKSPWRVHWTLPSSMKSCNIINIYLIFQPSAQPLSKVAVWRSFFLSAVGRRASIIKQCDTAQGQSSSCGFSCNSIAWLPVKRLSSSLSYSLWCLSLEPQTPTPQTSLHFGPWWQPVSLAARSLSSTALLLLLSKSQLPKNWASFVPNLSWRNKTHAPHLSRRSSEVKGGLGQCKEECQV